MGKEVILTFWSLIVTTFYPCIGYLRGRGPEMYCKDPQIPEPPKLIPMSNQHQTIIIHPYPFRYARVHSTTSSDCRLGHLSHVWTSYRPHTNPLHSLGLHLASVTYNYPVFHHSSITPCKPCTYIHQDSTGHQSHIHFLPLFQCHAFKLKMGIT